jgi:hypothetical protein
LYEVICLKIEFQKHEKKDLQLKRSKLKRYFKTYKKILFIANQVQFNYRFGWPFGRKRREIIKK